MIIMMPERKVKGTAKRLQHVLDGLGIELRYTACLKLSAQLHGFEDWYQYLRRELTAPLSPFDEQLSERAFAVRDEFQVDVLDKAGLGPIARELLDRVNPTGSWAKRAPAKELVWEATAGNDPL